MGLSLLIISLSFLNALQMFLQAIGECAVFIARSITILSLQFVGAVFYQVRKGREIKQVCIVIIVAYANGGFPVNVQTVTQETNGIAF